MFENQHQRHLRILGRLVLRLLVDEKEWSEDMHQQIEDAAMDLLLLETDAEGNYKLIPHE